MTTFTQPSGDKGFGDVTGWGMTRLRTLPFILLISTGSAMADPAEIDTVHAISGGNGWRFDVTLTHADTGWEDYADGWRVELADGTILGLRVLHHPHITEQPFTRSLSGIVIPENTQQVFIRARTLGTGWAEDRYSVTLE